MKPAVRAPGLWGQGSPLDIQQGAQEEASEASKKKHWAPGRGGGGVVSQNFGREEEAALLRDVFKRASQFLLPATPVLRGRS